MERINDILGYSGLKIYQNSDYFNFSLDSIILANYSNIRLRDKRIIDFCTGNAVIPIILSRRCDKNIDCIEVLDNIYSLAAKSIEINDLNDRINLFHMDVKDFCSKVENLNVYDLVLCNPPYFKNIDGSSKNLCYEKMVARHEVLINLDEVCGCAKRILKDNGNLCIVHRTDRLMEILDCFRKNNFEPKRVMFIYENINSSSYLVLVEGQKCGSVGLKVDKPLILYNLDGTMTDEYQKLQVEVRK